MATSSVSFLSLAYLIEISVVLNLTFRELKFSDSFHLHEKAEMRIKKILKSANLLGIKDNSKNHTMYPEYKELKSLLEPNDKVNLWVKLGKKNLGFYYEKFIKTRCSLKVANFYILYNVLFLIAFTFLSGKIIDDFVYTVSCHYYGITLGVFLGLGIQLVTVNYPCDGVFINFIKQIIAISTITALIIFSACDNTLEFYWLASFGALLVFTLTPLFFIRITTHCEEFLCGNDKDFSFPLFDVQTYDMYEELPERLGIINELAFKMFARYHQNAAMTDDQAKSFDAGN